MFGNCVSMVNRTISDLKECRLVLGFLPINDMTVNYEWDVEFQYVEVRVKREVRESV